MNTEKWAIQIDKVTSAFKKEFAGFTYEQLNWKPTEKVWSVAQNIEHLITVNETYYPVIKNVMEGSYKIPLIGKVGFMVNAIGNMILNSVKPTRKRKIKTFPIWEPSKSKITEDILSRFEKHQSTLKQMIASSSDLLTKGTVISSPANKNIVYTLEKAFDIIVAHEQRHFEQAKELLLLMKN
jgi:hypothetical protein